MSNFIFKNTIKPVLQTILLTSAKWSENYTNRRSYHMKKQVLILIGIIVLVTGFFYFTRTPNSQQGTIFEAEREIVADDSFGNEDDGIKIAVETEKENVLPMTVFVDVQGEVRTPGVFEVDADVRVGYLIALAGGLTADANVRGLNQAARVYDEMVIFVPHVDEIFVNGSVEITIDNSLISLSTASATQLQTLPGIGPALSANIIEHRNANGAFTSVDELINVAGIGSGIVENVREFVRP